MTALHSSTRNRVPFSVRSVFISREHNPVGTLAIPGPPVEDAVNSFSSTSM
jgi:hypothetical protein